MNALEIVENDMLDAQAGNSKDENISKSKIFEKIDKIDSISKLNEVLTSIRLLEIDYSSIKKYLAQRATLLDAYYNKERGLFVSSQATNSQIQAA